VVVEAFWFRSHLQVRLSRLQLAAVLLTVLVTKYKYALHHGRT